MKQYHTISKQERATRDATLKKNKINYHTYYGRVHRLGWNETVAASLPSVHAGIFFAYTISNVRSDKAHAANSYSQVAKYLTARGCPVSRGKIAGLFFRSNGAPIFIQNYKVSRIEIKKTKE